MSHKNANPVWGIVGGMGPVASAEFVKTVYSLGGWTNEQESPRIVLYSDPSLPDRTESFLSNNHEPLLLCVEAILWRLLGIGASRLAVCCVTAHSLLDLMDARLLGSVTSLLDLLLSAVVEQRKPALMLCTEGTRRIRLFESHPLWSEACKYVLMPDAADQARIHAMLYEIKRRGPLPGDAEAIASLVERYQARAYIAGCTEIHTVARSAPDLPCIDPLVLLGRCICGVDEIDARIANDSRSEIHSRTPVITISRGSETT